MKQYIGCDAHKKYSMFISISETGEKTKPIIFENTSLVKKNCPS